MKCQDLCKSQCSRWMLTMIIASHRLRCNQSTWMRDLSISKMNLKWMNADLMKMWWWRERRKSHLLIFLTCIEVSHRLILPRSSPARYRIWNPISSLSRSHRLSLERFSNKNWSTSATWRHIWKWVSYRKAQRHRSAPSTRSQWAWQTIWLQSFLQRLKQWS